jgi:hypothetical protein
MDRKTWRQTKRNRERVQEGGIQGCMHRGKMRQKQGQRSRKTETQKWRGNRTEKESLRSQKRKTDA